jgi:hypothetical protein
MGMQIRTNPVRALCAHDVSRGHIAAAACALFVLMPVPASAVTPESPEVRKLVSAALGYLEQNTDERLGGRCLIGLVFLKENLRDHPRVQEALAECRQQMAANPPDTVLDVYSNGLAVLFLCELSPQKYAREIDWYLNRLKARQKDHGGWGYHDYTSGDTSQTQFAALAYWEAYRRHFAVEGKSLENVANWLMKTQDPDGCWGYQGKITESSMLTEQTEKNCSMLAAGLGSVYICADLFGASPASSEKAEANPLPSALRRVVDGGTRPTRGRIRPETINISQLIATMNRAHGWMKENYEIDIGGKCYYYLYALERYKSLQDAFERESEEEPKWYNDGYQFLAKAQRKDGSWSGYCGAPCDTAFATLFLLRSMQKSIKIDLGEGTLLSGRGLPSNLSRAKLRNGQLIVEQVRTKVDELLTMIDDDEAVLDELARDPSQLVVDKVDDKSARRLQQLVRGGEPEVRLLAVRALGRSGNLDYVPSLLYALTDPDRRVVLEARDGLKYVSRNFKGFGPPDNFTEQQRFQAADAWKNWYKSLRPGALLEE